MRIFGLQVIVLFPSLLRCFLSRANVAFFWTQQSLHRQNRRRKESEGTSASRLSSLSLLSVSPFLRRGVVFVIRVCLIFYFCSFPSFQNRKGGKGNRRQGCVRLVSLPLFSLSLATLPHRFFFFIPQKQQNKEKASVRKGNTRRQAEE